jgi:hypothetical protein
MSARMPRYEPNLLVLSVPLVLGLGAIGFAAYLTRPPLSGNYIRAYPAPIQEPPPSQTAWPWPRAKQLNPHLGVHRWRDASSPDGTTLELIEFNFDENPGLRLELYDQDMDDEKPFDNLADYYPMGIGHATKHLNETRQGVVVTAWNGLFFGYDHRSGGLHAKARHVGPVVLDGKAHYNVGNPRWTFGVRHSGENREYKVFLQPDKPTLEREYDYAAAGAQYLVREGAAMRLRRPPRPIDPPLRQPVPCEPGEAGHIPSVDFLKTARTSMAWSKDSKRLYLLIVREPDNELESKLALRYGKPAKGGWSLADLQRFWLRFGAWGAVNVDGGVVTQMTCLRNDGKYDLLPPGLVAPPNTEMVFDPSFQGAPEGGTLMYFYVRDANRSLGPTRGAPEKPAPGTPRRVGQ